MQLTVNTQARLATVQEPAADIFFVDECAAVIFVTLVFVFSAFVASSAAQEEETGGVCGPVRYGFAS